MARVNVDECWWSDPRRSKLIELAGRRVADGLMLEYWRVGQDHASRGQLAPMHFFDDDELTMVERCGLAIRYPEGVYVRGSNERCTFLKAQKEKGRKSAEARAAGRRRENKDLASTQFNPAQPVQPSSSSSPSKKETTTTTSIGNQDLKEQIKAAWVVWNKTLRQFNISGRNIASPQESSIARAITQLGFENVILALEGQRYEKPSRDFDPVAHLSVDRVLHRGAKGQSNWERFVNMALAERERERAEREAQEKAEATG